MSHGPKELGLLERDYGVEKAPMPFDTDALANPPGGAQAHTLTCPPPAAPRQYGRIDRLTKHPLVNRFHRQRVDAHSSRIWSGLTPKGIQPTFHAVGGGGDPPSEGMPCRSICASSDIFRKLMLAAWR